MFSPFPSFIEEKNFKEKNKEKTPQSVVPVFSQVKRKKQESMDSIFSKFLLRKVCKTRLIVKFQDF